jgi:hypothetical protein
MDLLRLTRGRLLPRVAEVSVETGPVLVFRHWLVFIIHVRRNHWSLFCIIYQKGMIENRSEFCTYSNCDRS